MRSDSKNKNVDKNKLNKSMIEFLKKSPLVNSYLTQHKNRGGANAGGMSKESGGQRTVQSVMDLPKNKERGYQKSESDQPTRE